VHRVERGTFVAYSQELLGSGPVSGLSPGGSLPETAATPNPVVGRFYVGLVAHLSVIGVPNSAGSYAAGQEQAPRALRAAGLLNVLTGRGLEVEDLGDLPEQAWRPDPARPLAQNAYDVAESLRALRARLAPVLAQPSRRVLVLGGNCTVALAVVAALRDVGEVPGLLYVDRHLDLNTPATTTDGALDWMGLAHAFALPGSVGEVLDVLKPRPLLRPSQVVVLGADLDKTTEGERRHAADLDLAVISGQRLAADPVAATRMALDRLPDAALALHLDVDVLDFTDAPLAEDTAGRNSGPQLAALALSLAEAARDPRTVAFSVGELNPTRSSGVPTAVPRFVEVLAETLAASG
jgi:arginase